MEEPEKRCKKENEVKLDLRTTRSNAHSHTLQMLKFKMQCNA